MATRSTRRQFIQTATTGGTLLGIGGLSFLSRLPRVSADEARLDPKLVQFQPEIEPLVRLIEETPRNKVLEKIASQIHAGTSYREILGALLLAGVRNVQPRPSVGFKFHAVLVVNSAHLASLNSPESDRWLPIFWAIDNFKSSQADESKNSGWRMKPVEEDRVPSATHARQAFIEAMENWDQEAVDAAVAGLARHAGANEIFELFYRFGSRDYRSIGHKAIFVANSCRTLQSIGWRYAEPVLRSLAYALVNHTGEPNPAKSDLGPDHSWRVNQELAAEIPKNWLEGKLSESATNDLLATLRSGTNDDASAKAAELLAAGVSPQSVWDAVFVGAGELLMRQPGIIGLHSLTTANAIHYAFQASGNDKTRRFLLLQACSFLPMFQQSAKGRGKLQDRTVDDLSAVALQRGDATGAPAEIFADVSGNRMRAAGKIRAYLDSGGDPRELINTAQRLIFLKGRDSHDYKFSSAVLEDYYHVSPQWRDRFLATSVFNLKGSGDRDSGVVERTRAALDS